MKQYRQFLKEMPSKTVVFAFGRFNPMTSGHGLLINVVKKIASTNKADYVIYASKSQDKKKNPLPIDKKIHYLNLMFPGTNFKAANDQERTPIEVAKALNSKYKNLIMIAGSDRISSFESLLNKYNGIEYTYDSIQVVSAGERDPDSDDATGMSGTKMRAFASDGDYTNFKKGLTPSMRDIDGKRLMNDVRLGMGLDVIKENIKIKKDDLRERYINKEIFNIGDIVESNEQRFEIIDRGTNYLTVVDSNGQTSKKWLKDVVMAEQQIYTDNQFQNNLYSETPLEISFKGYTTKNLHNAKGSAEAFRKTIDNIGDVDPASVLIALKNTDEYLKITVDDILKGGKENMNDLLKWSDAHLRAKQALDNNNEFIWHTEYWHLYKDLLDKAVYAVRIVKSDNQQSSDVSESVMDPNKDKLKVAKVISSVLGGEDDKSSNPENLVNNALRKAKNLPKDSLKIVTKMLKLADEVGINYDHKIIKTPEVRAESYGRTTPNIVDKILSEKKAESIVASKTKPNLSSLRPDDEKKLIQMNNLGKGANIPVDIDANTKKEIENYSNTGHTSGIKDNDDHSGQEQTHVGASLTTNGNDTLARMKAKKLMNTNEDFTEEEIDELVSMVTEEDILETYEYEDFCIIDENGIEVIVEGFDDESLNEVLSKMERIKAKLRMAKYEPKLTAKREIALKKHSDSHGINNKARHLAIKTIKTKLLKGRDPTKLSTVEHERIDRIIEKKKKLIDRLALKLTSRVRQTEKNRLSHH